MKIRKQTPFKGILIFFFIFFLFSCQSIKIPINEDFTTQTYSENLYPEKIEWIPLSHKGFWQSSHNIKSLDVSWHCIKVDLDQNDLELILEPQIENLGKQFKLRKFAQSNRTIVSINTTPFEIKRQKSIPVGITKYKNEIITACVEQYSALSFSRNENNHLRAYINNNQIEENFEKEELVIGGFYTILDDGLINEFKKFRHSRTACGISHEGQYLYLFVTTPHFSIGDKNGLTYEECAIIMQQLGCTSAMQFDGGHSSGLYVYDKQLEVPFHQRKISAAFGIKINE